MVIKSKKINLYGKDTDPSTGVSNSYPTSQYALSQPCLAYIVGVRNSGKSYTCSKLVSQAQKEHTFDRIYMITPSFLSNVSYFGKFVDSEDVYEPTKDSIQKVIESVEQDRDDFEIYLQEKKDYDFFTSVMKQKRDLTDREILQFSAQGFLGDDPVPPPKWKYKKVRVPQSLVILDDILSSPAVLQSSGLTRIATLNRHIAPLSEPYGDRSACGLAVMLLSQTYSMPQGISRTLRENLTHMIMFKNKQEKMMEKVKEEIGSVVDEDKFMEAYKMATRDKHGNLLVDFNPKCPTMRFRKNLNELLIFDDDAKECNCKGGRHPL